MRDQAGARLRRVRTVLAESTDAGVLAILRFLGLLYGPIDTRLPVNQALKQAMARRVPAHASWRHALGGLAYLLFMLLVLTGLALSVHYRPSVQEAYPSLQHILSEVSLGWLVRDMHVWAANLIVLALLAHMARVLLDGSYKGGRETVWLVGLTLLLVVLAFGATGTLLPWDESAYWMVSEALGALAALPVVGGLLSTLLRGDPIVSGATLSRFFAVHVIVLPWTAFGLLLFHFALIRRQGVAPPLKPPATPAEGRPFFPNHLLRSFSLVAVTVAFLMTLAAIFPKPVGAPANPGAPPGHLITTWVAADVSRALTYYLGTWGFIAFLLIGIVLALVPLFDRGPERDIRKRPLVAGLGGVFFLGFLVLWIAGTRLHDVPVERPETPQTGAPAR